MNENNPIKRRRGRPPKTDESQRETRERVIRAGIEVLTESGFSGTGIDAILKRAGVPKGSFYHYFNSKQDFGTAVIEAYGDYFRKKLDRCLNNPALDPLSRLQLFVQEGKSGMERFSFRRGCLIGNMGQELGGTDDVFASQLEAVFVSWQQQITDCLDDAREQGQLPPDSDTEKLAAFFWLGWEGAILRAKLVRSVAPIDLFSEVFFKHFPAYEPPLEDKRL